MYFQCNSAPYQFKTYQDPDYLWTAAGRRRTCAGQHDHKDQHFGKGRPQVIVGRGISGSSHDGGHLESWISQALERIVISAYTQKIDCDQQRAGDHDKQVETKLRILKHGHWTAPEQNEIQVEVRSAHGHEDDDHPLKIWTVEVGHAVVIIWKTPCTYCTEGVQQWVVETHASKHKQQRFDRCKKHIKKIQISRCIWKFRCELVQGRTRSLCAGDHHALYTYGRKKRCGKYDDAHSAQPVGERTPEKHGFRQSFDIFQNCWACCGITGTGLKESINKVRNSARYAERYGTDERCKEPAQWYDKKPVSGLYTDQRRGEHYHDAESASETNDHSNKETDYRNSFLIDNGHYQGWYNTETNHKKQNAHHTYYIFHIYWHCNLLKSHTVYMTVYTDLAVLGLE